MASLACSPSDITEPISERERERERGRGRERERERERCCQTLPPQKARNYVINKTISCKSNLMVTAEIWHRAQNGFPKCHDVIWTWPLSVSAVPPCNMWFVSTELRAFHTDVTIVEAVKGVTVHLLVGCFTPQQQGRICSDDCTCCHAQIEAADQTFYLTRSQYTDTGPTSPSADLRMPGEWWGSPGVPI